jgi:hypothetical protein
MVFSNYLSNYYAVQMTWAVMSHGAEANNSQEQVSLLQQFGEVGYSEGRSDRIGGSEILGRVSMLLPSPQQFPGEPCDVLA